jgi:putative nucleotidyltransferase with HDIG domain
MGLAYTHHNFADARQRDSGVSGVSSKPFGLVELVEVDLRKKVFLYTAAVAALVSLIAVFLVQRLVATAGDAQFARQIGWDLLVIALSAGTLAAAAAWLVVRRVTLPLRRLAGTMSRIASSGDVLSGLASDFPSVGGGPEVRLIEETFRGLMESLEESRQARERSYVEAVGAVVTAADARDQETTGHSFRVALYAVTLAKALGFQGNELKTIEWGALLHDVGKMVVPDHILRKVGPLTDDEWLIMRQHPGWGYDMLAEVRFLQAASLDIIYSHHERWDGLGYPRGLAGEEIPIGARIFAVVDTYDAITSDRPYRRARSHQQAVEELDQVAGAQLDPHVVAAFRRLPEVEMRRLRSLCKRVHPGLGLPADLLDTLGDPERERGLAG